jgi:tetratricopeptide (TPR) repeat protein
MDLGDAVSAMDAYVQVTKLTPDDASAWFNFSVAARVCGSLGRAVAAAKRAVALSGKNALLHEHLGDMYLDLHRQSNDVTHLVSAVAAWQESLSLNPRQPELAARVEQYQKVLSILPAASKPAGGTNPATAAGP